MNPSIRIPTVAAPRAALYASALALLLAAPAQAIGPEAPVDFVDHYVRDGFVVMVIEPERLASLDVTRAIYSDGTPLAREPDPVPWRQLRMFDYTAPFTGPDDFKYRDPRDKTPPRRAAEAERQVPSIARAAPRADLRLADASAAARAAPRDERPKRVGVLIPLASDKAAQLKDGAYAEKILARAHPANEDPKSKPLQMVYWAHFVVRDGKPAYVSQAEYSRMVDPPYDGLDALGEKVQWNEGRGAAAKLPVTKTKLGRAVPLGRAGGLAPEREQPARRKDQDAGRNADESRER